MPTVELRFTPLPAHVRTARLVAASISRRRGVDEGLVDEIKLAVGEACGRAVALHEKHAPDQDVVVRLSDDEETFSVQVHDPGTEPTGSVDLTAIGEGELPELPEGVELAVIRGLVDDVEVTSGAGGTVVQMRWPLGR